MKNKKNSWKLLVTIFLVVVFIWFLIIWPTIIFRENENKLRKAAERYFELYTSELPTGERVKAVTLKTLYHKSFIEEDVLIPYTKTTCSLDNSWVKVKRVNGEYKYYVYLECGLLKSMVDHTGPVIKLNGEKEITLSLGESFMDPGVNSVVDNKDGKMDKSDVTVKGEVNTQVTGTYTLTYSAFDGLSNKGVSTRTVNVVQDLYSTVKKDLSTEKNYSGNPYNNYVTFSNMLFRIYGIDENDNIKIVADEDISNVNYSGLDSWLKYFYDHLTDESKKLVVDSKYCDMTLDENAVGTTDCSSYTKKRKVYIPSVVEVNEAASTDSNFMKTRTMSWVADKKDSKNAYVTRDAFVNEYANYSYIPYSVDETYGVRPMLTLMKNSLIIDGDGSEDNPYVLSDNKKAKPGDYVHDRYSGEYIDIGGDLFRIIESLKDGTTKVINTDVVTNSSEEITYIVDTNRSNYIYNVKEKNNVGYFINNKVSESIDTHYFVNHKIQVPIYKDRFLYGKEVETKEYNAILSAPNMYDLFSAQSKQNGSYWYLNSSKNSKRIAAVYNIGVPINEKIGSGFELGIRVVGYIKENATIVSGKGTIQEPYKIK